MNSFIFQINYFYLKIFVYSKCFFQSAKISVCELFQFVVSFPMRCTSFWQFVLFLFHYYFCCVVAAFFTVSHFFWLFQISIMLLLQKCTSTATTLCRRVSLTFRITSIPSSPLATILLLRVSKLLIFVVLFLNVIRMLSFRYYFFLLCSFPLHPVLLMVLLVCVFACCCCWHIVTFTILSMQSSRNSLTHTYVHICLHVCR